MSSMKYIDVVHIVPDDHDGVIKKMITRGEGDKPEQNQEVQVHYEGRLENGNVFDSSAKHGEPLKFIVGGGQVIEGWDKGVIEMQIGEKCDLYIKPKYAYGKMGSPPLIPPDATLIFTIELISITDRRKTRWMMTDYELIEAAIRMKEDGNLKFKNG